MCDPPLEHVPLSDSHASEALDLKVLTSPDCDSAEGMSKNLDQNVTVMAAVLLDTCFETLSFSVQDFKPDGTCRLGAAVDPVRGLKHLGHEFTPYLSTLESHQSNKTSVPEPLAKKDGSWLTCAQEYSIIGNNAVSLTSDTHTLDTRSGLLPFPRSATVFSYSAIDADEALFGRYCVCGV